MKGVLYEHSPKRLETKSLGVEGPAQGFIVGVEKEFAPLINIQQPKPLPLCTFKYNNTINPASTRMASIHGPAPIAMEAYNDIIIDDAPKLKMSNNKFISNTDCLRCSWSLIQFFYFGGKNMNRVTELAQAGRAAKDQGNYQKAISKFTEAINICTPRDDPTEIIDAFIDLRRIYQGRSDLSKAHQMIQQAEEKMKMFYSSMGSSDKQQTNFKLKDSYADYYCASAEVYLREDNPNFQIGHFLSLIDKSLHYYSKCTEICMKMLARESDPEATEFWSKQYLQNLINIKNPYILEAGKYDENVSYQHVLKISDKFMKFYKSSSRQFRKDPSILRLLSIQKYFRATSLKKLRRFAEVEKLLKEDFQFCKSTKDLQNLEKTRFELLNYYIARQELNKAGKYLKNAAERQSFNQYTRDLQTVNNVVRFIKSNGFKTLSCQTQIEKITNLYDKLAENHWQDKYLKMVQEVIKEIPSPSVVFVLSFDAARVCVGYNDFEPALVFVNQALQNVNPGTKQELDACCLKIEIVIRINGYFTTDMQQLLKYCENLSIKRRQDKDFKIWKQEQQILLKRRKQYQSFSLYSDGEQDYFGQISQSQESNDIHQMGENSNGFRTSFMINRNSTKNNIVSVDPRKQLENKYRLLCESKPIKVEVRKLVIKKIWQSNEGAQFGFEQLLGIDQQEIDVLFSIFVNINKWNFSNSDIKRPKHFLQNLTNKAEMIQNVKVFKFNQHVDKIQFLLLLLSKMFSLEFLDLSSSIGRKGILQFENNRLGIQNPHILKVLKLKSCHLQDSFLQVLSKFPNINSINLSSNQLKGIGSQNSFSKLFNLLKVNLSDNPFQNGDFSLGSDGLQKLKLKRLKKIPFQPFLKLINRCQVLDLSHNSPQIIVQLLNSFLQYVIENEKLQIERLAQIRLKKVNMNAEVEEVLNQLINLSPRFRTLDVRFSNFNLERAGQLMNYFMRRGRNVSVVVKGNHLLNLQ